MKRSEHNRSIAVRGNPRTAVPFSFWEITLLLAVGISAWSPGWSHADDESAEAAPSSFAPTEDLEKQIAYFVKRLEKQLADESDYNEDRQLNVKRDASTLAVISVVLANHDQPRTMKASTNSLLHSAQAIVKSASDYSQALAALEEFKKELEIEETSEPVDWTSSDADLAVLMKQVPIVNNALRRGVAGRRFKRSAERSAGLAATLAALAHVSAFDDAYCADEEDERLWRQYCDEMRDSSARVNQAVHDLDQEAAKKAVEQIVESCDRCHERFRD